MEVITIQVDGRFPGLDAQRLKKYLSEGWKIVDKTIVKERYILYVLQNNYDPDLGKCAP